MYFLRRNVLSIAVAVAVAVDVVVAAVGVAVAATDHRRQCSCANQARGANSIEARNRLLS